MRHTDSKTQWFLGLSVGLLYYVQLEYIGVLKASEILAIPYVALCAGQITRGLQTAKARYVNKIVLALIVWIIIQIVSDVFNNIPDERFWKALAGMLFVPLNFIFYWYFFSDDTRRIVPFLVGQAVSGRLLQVDRLAARGNLQNEFWDINVAVWAGPLLVAGMLYFHQPRHFKKWYLIAIAFGLTAIMLGGRLHGLAAFVCGVTGIAMHRLQKGNRIFITRHTMQRIIVSCLALGSVLFIAYVNLALSGNITETARSQISAAKNPYNPIEVVLQSRGNLLYGYRGMLRRPVFGYGSKADTGAEYIQELKLDRRGYTAIHSISFEATASGGVFAGLIWAYLAAMVMHAVWGSASKTDGRSIAAFYLGYSVILKILFSPLVSARFGFALMSALICVIASSRREC